MARRWRAFKTIGAFMTLPLEEAKKTKASDCDVQLQFESILHLPVHKAWEYFDRSLFEQLMPSFPQIKLKEFKGTTEGGTVELVYHIFGKTLHWVSVITEVSVGEDEVFFVDVGTELPFPFARWHHKHRLKSKNADETILIDEMSFSLKDRALNTALPIIKSAFKSRNRQTARIINGRAKA